MSLAYEFHVAHKQRLRRMSPKPPAPKPEPLPDHPTPAPIQVLIVETEVAAESLEVCILPVAQPNLTIEGIKRAVCVRYGVSHADIISPRRHVKITWARQVGMYLCRELTPRSYPEIARRFGGRDHTTGIHAYNKVVGLAAKDEKVAAEVSSLKDYLLS